MKKYYTVLGVLLIFALLLAACAAPEAEPAEAPAPAEEAEAPAEEEVASGT